MGPSCSALRMYGCRASGAIGASSRVFVPDTRAAVVVLPGADRWHGCHEDNRSRRKVIRMSLRTVAGGLSIAAGPVVISGPCMHTGSTSTKRLRRR